MEAGERRGVVCAHDEADTEVGQGERVQYTGKGRVPHPQLASKRGKLLVGPLQDLNAGRAEVGHLAHLEQDAALPIAQQPIQRLRELLRRLAVEAAGEAHDGAAAIVRTGNPH